MRVVSLVPSVTETLLDWGIEPVAVTKYCERPELRTVGGTKNPDVDAIVALRPDLVVVDREENRREDAAALEAAGVPLHVMHVTALTDVEPSLAALAGALGVDAPPVDLPAPRPGPPVRVWVPIWRRPWMTVNGATYGSTVLAAAGALNVFADADHPYPEVELGDVQDRHPAVVLVPSEPYPFGEKHRRELEAVAPVVFVDGKDLFWWGSRTAPACRRLVDEIGELAAARS